MTSRTPVSIIHLVFQGVTPDLEKATTLTSHASSEYENLAAYLPPLGDCKEIAELIFEKFPSIYERTKDYFYAYLSMCGCRYN